VVPGYLYPGTQVVCTQYQGTRVLGMNHTPLRKNPSTVFVMSCFVSAVCISFQICTDFFRCDSIVILLTIDCLVPVVPDIAVTPCVSVTDDWILCLCRQHAPADLPGRPAPAADLSQQHPLPSLPASLSGLPLSSSLAHSLTLTLPHSPNLCTILASVAERLAFTARVLNQSRRVCTSGSGSG
jgi:hypothetical protein